jgi:hypothetical protein
MGTRAMGDLFSSRAMDDEPVFDLLARDPTFAKYVNAWADEREAAIDCGERPESDRAQVAAARACAESGARWRQENLYKWRETV